MQNRPYIKEFDSSKIIFRDDDGNINFLKKIFKKIGSKNLVVGASYYIELEYKENFVEVVLKNIVIEEGRISKLVWELPDKTDFVENTFWYTQEPEVFVKIFRLTKNFNNTFYLEFAGLNKNFVFDGLFGNFQRI